MAPRRRVPSNTLSPQDLPPSSSAGITSTPLAFPRSNSPSGITSFLSRPSKWFTRSASSPRLSNASDTKPSRKQKISSPQDPRPIQELPTSEVHVNGSSRSVLDLPLTRTPGSLDLAVLTSQSVPSNAPPSPLLSSRPGDLRTVSRRPWSRSADDLGKMSDHSPVNQNFQEKVAQYRRERCNSNTSLPSSASPVTPRYPWPTIQPPSPLMSTTPPSAGVAGQHLSPIHISVSAPTSHLDDFSPAPREALPLPQGHNYPYALTPRAPKSSNSKMDPSSPRRKMPALAAEVERDRDALARERSRSNALPRGAFPFNIGPHLKPHPPPSHDFIVNASPLMPPPLIIEPVSESDGQRSYKRTSQYVHQSGFLCRFMSIPPGLFTPNHHHHHHHLANLLPSKGWKSFKVEARGAKLYFYKPPGDRASAIKELFVTRLVTLEEDEGEDDRSDGSRQVVESNENKAKPGKKRTFWGRTTHPDLVRSVNGAIERGTLEALVHEAVFATTFSLSSPSSSAEGERAEDDLEKPDHQAIAQWKEFASSILFGLPLLPGHSKLESEFMRCCSYLVSGADDDQKERERGRVCWLAGEYLRFHGQPIDPSAWDRWQAETIPEFVPPESYPPGLPVSSSTQAILVPSPRVGSETSGADSHTPNFSAFSSRPSHTSGMPSITDALAESANVSSSTKPSLSLDLRALASPPSSSPYSSALGARSGKGAPSQDFLLLADPQLVAQSLVLFHRSAFEDTPENFTASLAFSVDAPTGDSAQSLKLFLGTLDHPHWLTSYILSQILGPNAPDAPSRLSSQYGALGYRNAQTSRIHARSEVISVWAGIGELCRQAGDECSWRAIQAALCSRPIARLEMTWRCVTLQAFDNVKSWVHPLPNGEILGVTEPRSTPWASDIPASIQREMEKVERKNGDGAWNVEPLSKARSLFENLRTAFSSCRRKFDPRNVENLQKLVSFWRQKAETYSANNAAMKISSVSQYMSRSFATEPRRKGLFESYYWSRSSTQPSQDALMPLLFLEPLPYMSLLDRSQILHNKHDDNTQVQRPAFQNPIDIHMWTGPFGSKSAYGDLGKTIIPVFDGDLLLAVQAGPEAPNSSLSPTSRPTSAINDAEKAPSRSPSIRVKPGSSHGLDRKTSVARRSSLPTITSKRSFVSPESSSEPPLRVIVQAGSLDALIDTLIHGLQNVAVSVADDNGEIALKEGKMRELVLDRAEFAKVWWKVFRSFVTPLVFFELLRKRFINASHQDTPFPGYTLGATQIRSAVLLTIKEWMDQGDGSQDILDDTQLFDAFRAFLESPLPTMAPEAEEQNSEDLDQRRNSLLAIVERHIMRPPIQSSPNPKFSSRAVGFGRDPPDIDMITAEQLVDNLDAIASAAFSSVNEEDLFISIDILELQSADPAGWLPPRDQLHEDSIEIQSIYSHLKEVEASSAISELSQNAMYRLLPSSIRVCIRAHFILRRWLILKISALRLGVHVRQERMNLLLRAIEVARLRSAESRPSVSAVVEQPCIRSFVETVLTSAVLSHESRLFTRAWQNVASLRGTQCDALVSLLAKPVARSLSSKRAMTFDVGWIIERLLELISVPDFVNSQLMDFRPLINFDKRRHLFTLVATSISTQRARRQSLDTKDVDRLASIEKEVNAFPIDTRMIKEEASREALQVNSGVPTSGKKSARPFQRLVATQVEKTRRDKGLRERIAKAKRQEQLRHDKREETLNKALHFKSPSTSAQKQHRTKKSMSTAFFQLMRPLSTAFTTDNHVTKRTPKELDFVHTGKPALVLSLVDARVSQFVNQERSFTFQIDTEDGGNYLLQAIDKREMLKWIDTIQRISRDGAKRRSTYTGISLQPHLSDHILDSQPSGPRDPRAVFGVDLQVLLRREAPEGNVAPGSIPSIIERCLLEIESRGLSEVGIYRVAGAMTEINYLKESFNRGESPIQSSTDIYAVCDVVKFWFRVLPEPLFPSKNYRELIAAIKIENLEVRLATIRDVVQNLPQANFDLVKRVAEHLDRVTDFEEHNQMTAEALAIVFGPNLLRAPENDFALILANMGYVHQFVKALITHYHVIFDDADMEPEIEDDVDLAILEEEEPSIPALSSSPEGSA